jgi:hypothetical protein
MNLTKRLGRAAQGRPTAHRGGAVTDAQLDVTGATATVDLRSVREAHFCPQCGTQAHLDIDYRAGALLYLSCDNCFHMWQVRTNETDASGLGA